MIRVRIICLDPDLGTLDTDPFQNDMYCSSTLPLHSVIQSVTHFIYLQCGGVTREHYRQMVQLDESNIEIQVVRQA